MTYDRMKAKPIPGEHCRFCGDKSAPLVQTPCCHQWICCDTAYASFQGGGRCQYEHERFSLCYPHYESAHSGSWQTCQNCKDYLDPPDYKELYENSTPKFWFGGCRIRWKKLKLRGPFRGSRNFAILALFGHPNHIWPPILSQIGEHRKTLSS